MKNAIAILLVFGISSAAQADGFVCQTRNGDLNVKAYNHTQASAGTRNAAIMVLSDPAAESGAKTLAKFTDIGSTLSSSGAHYVASVVQGQSGVRTDAEISGTSVSEIVSITLDVEFKYNEPIKTGEYVAGTLTLNKHGGENTTLDLDCSRYLKN